MEFLLGHQDAHVYEYLLYGWLTMIVLSVTTEHFINVGFKEMGYIVIGNAISVALLVGLGFGVRWMVVYLTDNTSLANIAMLTSVMIFNASGRKKNRTQKPKPSMFVMSYAGENLLGNRIAPAWLMIVIGYNVALMF